MSSTDQIFYKDPYTAPTVSWLVCAHVSNEYLKASIESCLNQTYQDFELIIVLNGPNRDEIEEIICGWFPDHQKIRIYKTEIRHLIFSLNLGLNFARGKYIARMDSDDISSPDRLKIQSNFLDKNPMISVLGSAYNLIDSNGLYLTTVENPIDNASIRSALSYKNPINHPSVMVRRYVLLNAGGYNGGLHAEDYDLWCRLALDSNIVFANLREPLLNYRQIGIGFARKSTFAYTTQAASQLSMFLLTFQIKWLGGVFLSMGKALFISIKNRLI